MHDARRRRGSLDRADAARLLGFVLAGLVLAGLVLAPAAHAAPTKKVQTFDRVFLTPVSTSEAARADGTDAAAEGLSRAIEGAVVKKAPTIEVITPRGIDAKLDVDLARSCETGDDTSCVLDVAAAVGGARWVMRPTLSTVGSTAVLSLAVFDGNTAQLLGQAQRSANKDQPEALLAQVDALVVDAGRAAGMPMAVQLQRPFPYVPAASLIVGGTVVAVSGAAHLLAGLGEVGYQDAQYDRDGMRTWEAARLLALGAPFAGYAIGLGLVGYGAFGVLRE